jgi:hypothetical protein
MKVPISYDLIKDLDEGLRPECLLAFQDFCLDLFEEKYGRIPPEEDRDHILDRVQFYNPSA